MHMFKDSSTSFGMTFYLCLSAFICGLYSFLSLRNSACPAVQEILFSCTAYPLRGVLWFNYRLCYLDYSMLLHTYIFLQRYWDVLLSQPDVKVSDFLAYPYEHQQQDEVASADERV